VTRRWIVLLTLLGASAWLVIFGDKTPTPLFGTPPQEMPPSPPVIASQKISPSLPMRTTSTQKPEDSAVLALLPRRTLMAGSGSQHDLFASHSWAPPPPLSPILPPAQPVVPPLPFAFLGKKLEAGQWEVYLGIGDQTFIVREGTTLNELYRVDTLSPPVLSLTYLPLNQPQTLQIGGAD